MAQPVPFVSDPRIELVYQTQLLKMDRDFGRLNMIRTRTVSLLAAATLLVSFSVALGFINTDSAKGALTPVWASIALMAILVVILVLVWYVMSTANDYWTSTSVEMIEGWINDKKLNEDELKLAIIADMSAKAVVNNEIITRRRQASVWIMSLITASAIVLVAAVAFR